MVRTRQEQAIFARLHQTLQEIRIGLPVRSVCEMDLFRAVPGVKCRRIGVGAQTGCGDASFSQALHNWDSLFLVCRQYKNVHDEGYSR